MVPISRIGVPGAGGQCWTCLKEWGHTVMLDLGPPLYDISFDPFRDAAKLTFDLMFSKLAGEVREKQSRKTSVWGYDNGRSRLKSSAPVLHIQTTGHHRYRDGFH